MVNLPQVGVSHLIDTGGLVRFLHCLYTLIVYSCLLLDNTVIVYMYGWFPYAKIHRCEILVTLFTFTGSPGS